MTKRNEFSPKTKAAAWERAGGVCEAEGCDAPGDEYDHIRECWEDEDGGDNSLENCKLLCVACHKLKSSEVKGLRAWGNHFRVNELTITEKRARKSGTKRKIQSRNTFSEQPKRTIPQRHNPWNKRAE